ncbi:DUF6884 domain-containing protein [Nitrolancea hollandica]|uniref:DUF6884 domain-containing protein n=1 Tax=Nitrolancea hollandica TaxID=1206749 RepID=UPI001930C25F|nr:DUF6884 domain-containing protein [Nitrolancea hollandica]
MKGVLVVVPCGQQKIWDKDPNRGPVPAQDVYTGSPFVLNRKYAERLSEQWVILSAKYGFISPSFVIPGPYNVTFKKQKTGPISIPALQDQVRAQTLDRFKIIVGLGGKEYRAIIESVFAPAGAELYFPFAGLPIGKAMQATKRALAADEFFPNQMGNSHRS